MIRILFIFCFYSLLCASHAAVPLAQFFAFGPENGDQPLSNKHSELFQDHPGLRYEYGLYGISGLIDLEPPLTILNQSQNFVIVHVNGFIGFGAGYRHSGYINVFRSIMDLSRSGNAYWRKSNATDDLDKARQEIGSAFPDYRNIDLKWTVVATWYQIAPFRDSYDAPNTFQAILTTDGVSSFALLYYNQIGWVKKFPYGSVGFEWSNNNKDYPIRGTNKITQYDGISTISNRSNVGRPGKWIFQIDRPIIYEPNPLCEVPPQPENGFCKTEEFDPDSVAQCGCKPGYKPDTVESLKCSRLADNRTVGWTGSAPKCCPTRAPLTPCDCLSPIKSSHVHRLAIKSPIDHRLMDHSTAYEFTLINDTKLAPSKKRQRVGKRYCIDSMPRCLIDIDDVCSELEGIAYCIDKTRVYYSDDEHERIFHLKIPNEWQNNNNCKKAVEILNDSEERLEPKECPSLPVPKNLACRFPEKKPYLNGAVAHCYCLPDNQPAPNTNYNTEQKCSRDRDGHLYWSGNMPVCVLKQ